MIIEELAVACVCAAVGWVVKRYCGFYQEVKQEWQVDTNSLSHYDSSGSIVSIAGGEISGNGTIKLKIERRPSDVSEKDQENFVNPYEGKWVWFEALKRTFGRGEKKDDTEDTSSLSSLLSRSDVFDSKEQNEDPNVNMTGEIEQVNQVEVSAG